MVRTTIACARCRRLKVKCLHDGSSPCRNCQKKGSPTAGECVLSHPVLKSRHPRPLISGNQSRPHGRRLSLGSSTSDRSGPRSVLLASTILQAATLFVRKFPELRFLNLPAFSKSIRAAEEIPRTEDRLRSKIWALGASIVALCSRLDHSSSLTEEHRDYVRRHIIVADHPDTLTVQTLLIVALDDWGSGNGYRAWMYSGMAIRMMQSLLVLVKPGSLIESDLEAHNRTLWSCFVVDRLVFCGKPQPFGLAIESMHTHWPIGEQDFIFGHSSEKRLRTDDDRDSLLELMRGDVDHYYGVLVRGFGIWAKILQWVVNGGRRQTGMCGPKNHPWVQGSPWRIMYEELYTWRNVQDARLRFPQTGVEAHATLGQGEVFAFVNLIYYVSILFLTREYIPFVPTLESTPCGPVDPPLLTEQAPEDWWIDRSQELFEAAAHIVVLLQALENAGSPLVSPFAGFCSFSAASMNSYIMSFPNMNMNLSSTNKDVASVLAANIAYLDKFRKTWPMGEGWWITTQHALTLYEHASQGRIRGRRDDFSALEYSMHDCRGQPPSQTEISLQTVLVDKTADVDTDADVNDVIQEAALSLRDLSGTHRLTGDGLDPGDLASGNVQIWPLWGEQADFPFAVEGIPFDYNLDMLNV